MRNIPGRPVRSQDTFRFLLLFGFRSKDRKMGDRKMGDRKMGDRKMDDRKMDDRKMGDRKIFVICGLTLPVIGNCAGMA